MTFGVLLLTGLVLFMLAGVLPVWGGPHHVLFRSPVFVSLLGVVAAWLLACCWQRRRDWRSIPLHLARLGVVLILAGALVKFLAGKEAQFLVPVGGEVEVRQVPANDGKSVELGFGISVARFDISFYERAPGLHQDERNPGTNRRIPSHFAAGLRIAAQDGAVQERELTVNHPVSCSGWRIYLMSYDDRATPQVVLRVKRDPGLWLVKSGIWVLIIGVSTACFGRTPGGETPPDPHHKEPPTE